MNDTVITGGPLAPSVLEELEGRLKQIQRPKSPEQFALRLYQICDTLIGGKAPREIFLLAAAVALCGAEACAARDRNR